MNHWRALLCASFALLATTQCAIGAPSGGFGLPLSCGRAGETSLDITRQAGTAASTPGDAVWVEAAMARVGYPAKVPTGPGRDDALRSAALLRTGHLVAAKMLRDDAARAVPAFRTSTYSSSFDALLTILTQPVPHASTPSSVHADGEQGTDASKGTSAQSIDLDQASRSLNEVISRAAVSRRAMGAAYGRPTVRFYLLAQGFRDDVALKAATADVCAERLDAATVKKLNVSARYMAMPTAVGNEGGHR